MAWRVVLPVLLVLAAYMQTWQLRMLPSNRTGMYAVKMAMIVLRTALEVRWTRWLSGSRRRAVRWAIEILRWAAFLVVFEPTPELRARLPLRGVGTLLWLASWNLPGSLKALWPRGLPWQVRRTVRLACSATMFLVWPWMVLEMAKASMLTLLVWAVWDERQEVWDAVAMGGALPLTRVLSRGVL